MSLFYQRLFEAATRTGPAIFDTKSLSRVESLLSHLPNSLSTSALFECRLAPEDSRIDLSFQVRDFASVGQWLATKPKASDESGELWGRVEDYLEIIRDNPSSLGVRPSNLWLEFDLDSSNDSLPDPCVFIGSNQKVRTAKLHNNPELVQFIIEALKTLEGENFGLGQETLVRTLCGQLPEEARFFQVGVMLKRDRSPKRLVFKKIPSSKYRQFLTQINWPGSIDKVCAFINSISEVVPRLDPQFEIVEGLEPYLGFECHAPGYGNINHPQWIALLDRFVELGLCCPRKKEALLNWPHRVERVDESSPKPFLSHVKLVWREESLVDCKAYFGLYS